MQQFRKIRSKVRRIKDVEGAAETERDLLSTVMVDYSRRVLHDAVEQVCSTMEGAQRWGMERGYVRSGIIRVPIERPRVRRGQQEILLPAYEKLQSRKTYDEATRRLLLGGLATRQFAEVGEVLGSRAGLSKSTVSRISRSFAQDYEALMKQDCSDIRGVLIDGIGFGGEILLIAALGVSRFSRKRLLGLWAGSTENAEVVMALLKDLQSRGLDPKLFTIDGSKALRSGIERLFPEVPIHRCQQHKRENVLKHLPEGKKPWARMKMKEIFTAPTYEEGYALGKRFSNELAAFNRSAQASWEEGFPETLVVLQISDPDLRRFFATTNGIESLFSGIRTVSGRVKRWRTANQALYWTSGAYTRISKNLKKIRGGKNIQQLDNLEKNPTLTRYQAAA
jgi:transposase-like protein